MDFHLIFILLLSIHVTCGFISLFSAFGALLSPKGKPKHRLFGKCFFYGMTIVFITAIPLALMIKSLFLFLIAIFSYYLALTGWRYAHNRSGVPAKLDWTISLIMLLASVVMIGFSLYGIGNINFMTILLLVFGIIGGTSSIDDLKTYLRQNATGKQRIVKHLSGMLGATIAALTAFSVTNIHIQPEIIVWLAPTVILAPLIVWWKYRVVKGNVV